MIAVFLLNIAFITAPLADFLALPRADLNGATMVCLLAATGSIFSPPFGDGWNLRLSEACYAIASEIAHLPSRKPRLCAPSFAPSAPGDENDRQSRDGA